MGPLSFSTRVGIRFCSSSSPCFFCCPGLLLSLFQTSCLRIYQPLQLLASTSYSFQLLGFQPSLSSFHLSTFSLSVFLTFDFLTFAFLCRTWSSGSWNPGRSCQPPSGRFLNLWFCLFFRASFQRSSLQRFFLLSLRFLGACSPWLSASSGSTFFGNGFLLFNLLHHGLSRACSIVGNQQLFATPPAQLLPGTSSSEIDSCLSLRFFRVSFSDSFFTLRSELYSSSRRSYNSGSTLVLGLESIS